MTDHCFISYSNADGLDFATSLSTKLYGRLPIIPVWFDKNDLDAGEPWDSQIAEAIRGCKCLVFLMTDDSTTENSVCKDEWTWALKYKKPIIPLRFHPKADLPFRLNNLQYIDFVSSFDSGIAQLRERIVDLDSPEGQLKELKLRLSDAQRDLRRAAETDQPRIQADIDDLKRQIERQEEIVKNPKAAEELTQKNIEVGLKNERQPKKPISAKTSTKLINPPPGIAPNYFQDRQFETRDIVKFLNDDAQRLMTIVGRGGVGKTAMVCRLLKALESGGLPDNLGDMKIDGIVYLSESGSHRVNFPNIFADLSKLLPSETAEKLGALYKDPKASIESKMSAMLEHFQGERVLLLLDNFEPVVDPETQEITDSELNDALCALVSGPHHMVNALITTRVAPRDLNLCEPGRQRVLTLDKGLESPYAENILREMDEDGKLGLKGREETDPLLQRAREKTRGYPRALEALFAILSSDRYTTLEELLEMPLPENVVEALVGEAFNRLDATTQKVMQALAVYNRPVKPAAVDYLLQPHLPEIDSAPMLNRLVTMYFVRHETGRYYLHPVDHEYAFDKIPTDSHLLVGDGSGERSAFTQHNLLIRAADYFAQTRKPRTEWKKLDDLAAQLAEFDLRCTAGDYDTAASVLTEIDYNYLLLWGHYRLMINLREILVGHITDKWEKGYNLTSLGRAYQSIGETRRSITFLELALELDREIKDRQGEGVDLTSIGNAYAALGDVLKAIKNYEQALVITREIGDRNVEGVDLCNLGIQYVDLGNAQKAIEFCEQALVIAREMGDRIVEASVLGTLGMALLGMFEYDKAIENFNQSIQIADEISFPIVQREGRWGLAQAYLFQNALINACTIIKTALQYDAPQYKHNATTLHGIITLRQGDVNTARQAFMRAIAQVNEILTKTPDYYSALDAKGLSLCGIALCADDGPSTVDRGKLIDDAVETFRAARKIAPHAGIVKSVLRLFDELAKCDPEGLLEGVREVVDGK